MVVVVAEGKRRCLAQNDPAASEQMSGKVLSSGHSGLSKNSMKRSDPSSCTTKPQESEQRKSMFPSARCLGPADEFEKYGMQSLSSSLEQGGARETGKTLPPEIRQLIVDLHVELPTMSAARNCRGVLHSLRETPRS